MHDEAADALDRLGIASRVIDTGNSPVTLRLMTGWTVPDERAMAMLSDAESTRAARFGPPHLRDRYIAAHAALRTIVENDFAIPQPAQRYRIGASGKPALVDHPDKAFSLSYGDDHLLIGTGHAIAIGVDIEHVRPIADARELAALHYTPSERAALAARTAGSREHDLAFLAIWTRKEACVKALGLGLGDLALPMVECGAGGTTTVRIGDCQLRTDTSLVSSSYMVSWAWKRIGRPSGSGLGHLGMSVLDEHPLPNDVRDHVRTIAGSRFQPNILHMSFDRAR